MPHQQGVAGHAEPGAAEDEEEEKADDVRAAAPAVAPPLRRHGKRRHGVLEGARVVAQDQLNPAAGQQALQ